MSKKKKYTVAIPIAGVAYFSGVEATSAKEAVQAALDSEKEPDVEWEYCDPICEGNVLHAPHNKSWAELEKET